MLCLMMTNTLSLVCGIDIPIPECQLILHQPKLYEIAFIGEQSFFTGIQTLCINKNMISQGETVLADTSNFQIFMTIMHEQATMDKKADVLALLNLLFPTKKVMFTPRSMMFIENNESIMVDETNFEPLQEVVKDIFCVRQDASQGFNPQDAKAREIAEKLMRGRQRVAAQNGEEKVSVLSQYISVLTVALGSMSFEDCTRLTVFQLYDLIERYGLYINWDLDVRSRLAGGKPDKQPDNWMKNIH